jgi:hypothetical protein
MFAHKFTLKGLQDDLEFTKWRITTLQANSKVDPNFDVYALNMQVRMGSILEELVAAYEHMELNPLQPNSTLANKVKDLTRQNKQLVDKKKRLTWQITSMQESLADRNKKLDALHHIWCNPGCLRGIHRKHPHLELTEAQVKYLNYHVEQINSVYYNSMKKKPRWWHVWYWKWQAKKYEKWYKQERKVQESNIQELTKNRLAFRERQIASMMGPLWRYAWMKMWEEIGNAVQSKASLQSSDTGDI